MSDYVIRKDENGNEVRMPLPLEEYVILLDIKVSRLKPIAPEWTNWINPNDDPENIFMHPNTWFTLSDGMRIMYQRSDNGIEGCYTLVSEENVGKRFKCSYNLIKTPQVNGIGYQSIWSDMCERKGVFKRGKFRNGITYIPTGYATFHVSAELKKELEG